MFVFYHWVERKQSLFFEISKMGKHL